MYVMVTGHRPNKLANTYNLYHPINIAIGKRMRELILSLSGYDAEEKTFAYKQPITMVTGMAIGVDTIWAMVCLKLKKEFPGQFRLYCAIPCQNHSKKWKINDQNRYQKILSQADEVYYVSNEEYTNNCMQDRNEHMVDVSNYAYAIWDGSPSGTKNCIDYIKKKGIPCQIDNPTEWIQSYQDSIS